METLTTNTSGRNTTANGTGTASYVFATDAPPAWLVSAVPGAADAKAAWEAENAKGRELHRSLKAAQKAAPATLWTRTGKGENDRFAGPASGVTYAEWEAGQAAVRDAERAVDAQSKRALAALRKFDAIVYGANLSPSEYRELAAAHALKKHTEAAAAWETLKTALGERDAAWNAAGTPGLHWTTRSNALPGPVGAEAKSENLIGARIESFDVDAVKRTADGDAVKSAAEIHAEAVAAAEAARKASAANARKRARTQGFN